MHLISKRVPQHPSYHIAQDHRWTAIYRYAKPKTFIAKARMNKRTTTLQEVLAPRTPTSRNGSLVVRYGAEYLEVRLEILA
jgi:hypothetical protein